MGSASMTSSVGLELDLTWKTVSKGNRSGTRRTRKSVAKNLIGVMQPSDENSRPAEGATVFVSEKQLGVAVLGRRFSDKIEHVPIKKRRFMFRSPSPPPSPPQTHSPLLDVSEQHKEIQSASGQTSFPNSTQDEETTGTDILTKSTATVVDGNFSEVKNEKLCGMVDFSGIEMLAAAACNDGVDDYADNNENQHVVEKSKQERNDGSLASLGPSEEATALLQTEFSQPKVSGATVLLETDFCLSKYLGNEVKRKDSSLLPSKGSVNKVKRKDSSLVNLKDSDNVFKMEESSLPSSEDAGNDCKTNDSCILDNVIAVFRESPVPKEKKAGVVSIAVPDDRSLWDLNLSIDAWDRPCDNEHDDSFDVDNMKKVSISHKNDFHNLKSERVDIEVSFDVEQDKCLPSNLGALLVEIDGLNGKESELERCSSLIGKDLQPVPLTANSDADVSARSVEIGQLSISPCSGADNIIKEEITETSPSRGIVKLGRAHCSSLDDMGKITCNRSVKLEESDKFSPSLPALEMAVTGVGCKFFFDDRRPHSGDSVFQDEKISAKEMEICDFEGDTKPKSKPANGLEDTGICHSSPRCKDMLASGSSVIVDVKGHTGGVPSASYREIDHSAVLVSEKTSESFTATPATSGFNLAHHSCQSNGNGHTSSSIKVLVSDFCNQSPVSAAYEAGGNDVNSPTSCSDKVNVNDPCSRNHEGSVSPDNVFIEGKQNSLDLQTGYDSQFEDGELRDSEAPWDEIEQVDYDTEGEEDRLCGMDAENDEEKLKTEKGSSPGADDIIERSRNSNRKNVLRDNSVSSMMVTETVIKVNESNNGAISFGEGVAVKDPHSALDGPRTSKREFLGIEASKSSDDMEISRSYSCDDLNHQGDKDGRPDDFSGRDRSASYVHARSPGGGAFVSHLAGQSSTIYHRTNSSLRSRQKGAFDSRGYMISTDQEHSESADSVRTENHVGRHFMSSHSNGMYRPLVRKRSPAERDVSFGMRTRMETVRDTSPNRTRFRRYLQGVHRGFRDEYPRQNPDDNTSEFIRRMPSSDGAQRSRSGNFDGYAQSERVGGFDKFIGRDRLAARIPCRSRGGGQFFNHLGGIRNEYIKNVTDDGVEYFRCLPSSDALLRNRSDDFDNSYHQAEREGSDKFIGRERPMSHVRGRSPGDGQFFNPSAGYWDPKRQHSPSHRGSYHSACPRPKNAIEGRGYVQDQELPEAASMTTGPENRIIRPFMSSASNEGYRPYMRRRSPVGRDDSYGDGMHMRVTSERDGSPPNRSRFRRYRQGVGRGVRDDFMRHEPVESAEYINRVPQRLARRERSISPESYYPEPFKKTRPRSRSRSPMVFPVQRDQNDCPRRQNRPDFRSDGRIDRVRLFPKRFPAEYGEGFISPPRSQQSSRVFEDRNSGIDHLRGRKSPVRMFRESKF